MRELDLSCSTLDLISALLVTTTPPSPEAKSLVCWVLKHPIAPKVPAPLPRQRAPCTCEQSSIKKILLRLHTSSGTTGKPKALFFSARDVENAADQMARCLVMSGVTRKDVLQNMMTYGLFTGALVMHYGAEKVGCLVIPAGPGNSERQLLLMQDFRTTAIHATPSYALYFADFLEKHGVNPRKDLALRRAFVGAEPYTEETRRKIELGLGIDVYNCYGLSEMNGPGVAFECEHKHGMHLWEDNFLLEIIDPQTGEPLTITCSSSPSVRRRTISSATSVSPFQAR